MPHNIDLILTFTGGLTAALVFGYITERLRLSPLVGYLIAGVMVGPFTPGFVAQVDLAKQLAEVGVILLMFGVGMHFHLKDLLAVRKIAIPGALVQIAAATGLAIAVTQLFDWSIAAGAVYGLAIAVASTVVLLRVLADNDELHTPAGHVAVGWLLVEDLFTVLVLVLLPLFSGPGSGSGGGDTNVAWAIVIAVLKVSAFVAITLVVGARVIPVILRFVARTGSRELFTLTVLVIALGIAVGAVKVFGASMELGAFLAGMVVGQSEFGERAASEALPLRDAFAVLFFVAMGMLCDPNQLAANLPLTLATLGVVLIGKPVAAFAVVRLLRYPLHTAFAVAIALAQVGEFSFILAQLGLSLGMVPVEAIQALVAAAIIAITLNPLLFRYVERLSKRYQKTPRPDEPDEATVPEEGNIIVIGCGPVGKQVVTILQDHHIVPTVIDLNVDTVRALRAQGVRALYGDASQRDILEAAGIRGARGLVFASAAPPLATVKMARELNPEVTVLTRTAFLRDAPALLEVGASVVVAEAEVALAFTEYLLRTLGATAQQLDRARDRVHDQIAHLHEHPRGAALAPAADSADIRAEAEAEALEPETSAPATSSGAPDAPS